MKQQTEKVQVVIHRVWNNTAFATRTDGLGQAVITQRMTRMFGIEQGQTWEIEVIPNRHDMNGETPWFCCHVGDKLA